MSTKIWQKIGMILAVFLGGTAIVFISFILTGFPFAADPIPNLIWVEFLFLVILLGLPLLS